MPTSVNYDVIIADPPWRFESRTPEGKDKSPKYPTMPLKDIKELPVRNISHAGTVLFLWATSPMLPEALATMAAWGFRYRSSLVWVKDRIGTGYWARNRHELVLIGGRSAARAPVVKHRPDSVIMGGQRSHSHKPDDLHLIAEEAYPDAKCLEMFARRERPGWTVWGDQVSGETVLTNLLDMPS